MEAPDGPGRVLVDEERMGPNVAQEDGLAVGWCRRPLAPHARENAGAPPPPHARQGDAHHRRGRVTGGQEMKA
jgi:hypothetical protein